MTAAANLVELLNLWETERRPIRAIYARAEGETAVRIQGTVQASSNRLVIQARDASLIFPLTGAKLEYGPLRFVPPPFNRLESIDGLHIRLESHDWAFLTDGREIPEEVAQLAVQLTLLER